MCLSTVLSAFRYIKRRDPCHLPSVGLSEYRNKTGIHCTPEIVNATSRLSAVCSRESEERTEHCLE